MFKLDHKLVISTSTMAMVALFAIGCVGDGGANVSAKNAVGTKSLNTTPLSIDGGVVYPMIGDKTGPYRINADAHKMKINNGRIPTANELKAWNTDVMPDGTGLPEGEGSVEDGEELYEAQCVMCHGDFGSGGGGYPALAKGNAYDLQKTMKNQRDKPDTDGPVRMFGSYWPEASTLWWYTRDGMPHPFSKSLTNNEVYALVAYILNINEFIIDGVEVDDDYVLNREKFLKIKMPNKNGFEPNIDGPNTLAGVRAYYANEKNFGGQKVQASKRCMKDCQKDTAKVVHIKGGGISEFNPPMSVVKDLPAKEEKAIDVKAVYTNACVMCHDGFLSPASPEWAGYTKKGMDKVYANGINGKGGMPAKGGADLSDKDFKTMVDYLVSGKIK